MKKAFLPAAHWNFLTPYYEALARPFARPIWRRVTDEVVRRAPVGGMVSDLGCGPGTLLRLIAEGRPDLQLHGIDVDPAIIAIAKEKNTHPSSQYHTASIDALPMGNASVDMATSTLMFHHLAIETQRGAFREVRRILKPDGMFLLCDFSVPRRKWLTPIASTLLRIEASAPLQLRGQLFALAQEQGAKIQTVWSIYGCISLHIITF